MLGPSDLAALGQWVAYLVVFAAAALEAVPALGLLVPGAPVIGAGALLSAQGLLSPWAVFGLALLGSLAGDWAGYAAGRRLGLGFVARVPIARRALPPRRIDALGKRLHERPFAAIAVARFQLPVRCLVPYLAGASGLPATRFGVPNFLAAIVCTGSLVVAGLLLGYGYAAASHWLGGIVLALAVLAGTAYLAWSLRKSMAARRQDAASEGAGDGGGA